MLNDALTCPLEGYVGLEILEEGKDVSGEEVCIRLVGAHAAAVVRRGAAKCDGEMSPGTDGRA
jgi:hypothetical protein